MKKIIILWMFVLIVLPLSVEAFTTKAGNEITFILDTKDSRPLKNGSVEWIPRVDHANDTIHYGHLEYVFYNWYRIPIPYIIGITFNGIDIYHRGFYSQEKQEAYIMSVPAGDRNWKEFGCRDYEIRKGVCRIR